MKASQQNCDSSSPLEACRIASARLHEALTINGFRSNELIRQCTNLR